MPIELSLRRTWPDNPDSRNDFVVIYQGRSVARIMLQMGSFNEQKWSWSVYGFSRAISRHTPITMSGKENDLEAAKAEVRAVIERIVAAGFQPDPLPPEWRPGSAFK